MDQRENDQSEVVNRNEAVRESTLILGLTDLNVAVITLLF